VSTTRSLRDLVEGRGRGHAQALAEAASTADVAAIVHWLGVVLGLQRADDGTAIDPETVKEELFWALRRFFARLAASQPLVLAFEDIHWADSSLLDFIAHLRDSLPHLPIFIICQARPEMAESGPGAAWVARSRASTACTFLELQALTEPESHELIHDLLPNANLPPSFETLVLSKAEGNPLYVEELMRILIDSGTLDRRNGGWVVVKALEGTRIPGTIQALVGARLDTLPEMEKRVIQGASVVGRIFWHGAVDQMFPQMTATQVQTALDMLESREFIVKRSNLTFTGETEYSFRNVLMRDVAYKSLPKALRGEAHAHVAAWIESKAGDRLREFADLLAYHYEQALLLGREMLTLRARATAALEDKTIHFLELAGDVASERQALAEAEQYYWRALDMMGASERFPSDGGSGPLHDRYLSVLCSHAGIVAAQEDYLRALAELNTAIDQAHANSSQRARALLKRAEVDWQLGNLDDVLKDATAALHLFRRLGERRSKAEARLLLGSVHRHRDNMDAAEGMLTRALALFRAVDDPAAPEARAAADLRGEARAMRELGIVALHRNDMPAASRYMLAALEACRRLGDRWGMANCLRSLAQLHSYEADLSRFNEYVQAALILERELGHTHGEATALVTLGFVHADRRRLDEGEQLTQEALAILLRLGDRRAAVWALRTLGMIAGLRGDPAAGRGHYEQALEMAQAGGIMGVLPELYRGLAEVLLVVGAVDAALDMAEAGTRAASAEDSYSQGTTWRALALAQHAAGRSAEARLSLECSLRSLPAHGYPLERARSCAALAALAADQDDPAAMGAYRGEAQCLLDSLVWTGEPAPRPETLLMLATGPAGPVP
jgi:tetratricopeptide (TPR) repeat protein